jgi:hypothetical protein
MPFILKQSSRPGNPNGSARRLATSFTGLFDLPE